MFGLLIKGVELPGTVAGETVLGKRAFLGELGEADGNAAADGLFAVVDGGRRGVDHLAASAVLPRGDVGAMVVDLDG